MKKDDKAVERLQRYLTLRTDHPNPDFTEAVAFLQEQAQALGLDFYCVSRDPKWPVVVLILESDADLPYIIASSHMDVVTAAQDSEEDGWMLGAPFSGKIVPMSSSVDAIVARGSQDMKSVGMAYLEGLRKLSPQKSKMQRNLALIFTPDEEIGSANGMAWFASSNVPLAERILSRAEVFLDEGCPESAKDCVRVFFRERTAWWMRFTITGMHAGHGSGLPTHSAMNNFITWALRIQNFRYPNDDYDV